MTADRGGPSGKGLKTPEIDALLTRLDELVRWRPGASGKYQDAQGALARIQGAANHVVMGRRGSGKTRLLDELRKRTKGENTLVIAFGAEDYKELTYPDILIQILRSFLREFEDALAVEAEFLSKEWWAGVRRAFSHPIATRRKRDAKRRLLAEVRKLQKHLDGLLTEADELSALYVAKTRDSTKREEAASASLGAGAAESDVKTATSAAEESEQERRLEQREFKRTKVERLLGDFKHLLTGVCRHVGGTVILAVDDFYFIRRADQPAVIDYIHRICKDTDAFLKVATIRHRTQLSERDEVTRGVVAGHEIQPIDLELSLGHFDSIQHFLEAIWVQVCAEVEINAAQEIFMGEGFSQAVLASGGVPRDFFGVVKAAIQIARERNDAAVGKLRVNEAARRYTEDTKLPEVQVDAPGDREVRDLLLYDIVRFARDQKRKNCFHVDIERLAQHPDVQRLLDSLVDGRLVHLITDTTSNARRAGQYAAYLLDVGLYAHPQRRGDNAVEEVLFWHRDDAGRLVNLQRSPVYQIRTIGELRAASEEIGLDPDDINAALLLAEDEEQVPERSRFGEQIALVFPALAEEVGEDE